MDGIGDACEPPTGGGFVLGDVNDDLQFDIDDKPAFVALLLNPSSSSVAALLASDMDANGVVNGRDLQLFVDGLLGG